MKRARDDESRLLEEQQAKFLKTLQDSTAASEREHARELSAQAARVQAQLRANESEFAALERAPPLPRSDWTSPPPTQMGMAAAMKGAATLRSSPPPPPTRPRAPLQAFYSEPSEFVAPPAPTASAAAARKGGATGPARAAVDPQFAALSAPQQDKVGVWQQLSDATLVPKGQVLWAGGATAEQTRRPSDALAVAFEMAQDEPALSGLFSELLGTLTMMGVPHVSKPDKDASSFALRAVLDARLRRSAMDYEELRKCATAVLTEVGPSLRKEDVVQQLGAALAVELEPILRKMSQAAVAETARNNAAVLGGYLPGTVGDTQFQDGTGAISKKASVTAGMKVSDDLLSAWNSAGSSRDVPPIFSVFADCASGGEEALRTAVSCVQGDMVSAVNRAAVFKFVSDASVKAHPGAKAVRSFQSARVQKAKAVIRAHGIPHNEALIVELAFCLPGNAGLLAYFPMSHRVRRKKVTDPALITFEELLWLFSHHQALMGDMGWVKWQPLDEYAVLERRIRGFSGKIHEAEVEAGVPLDASRRLHADILLLWADWKEISAEHGQSRVLDGHPFPSIIVAGGLLGDKHFPRFGSNFKQSQEVLATQLMHRDMPLYAAAVPAGAKGAKQAAPPLQATPALPSTLAAEASASQEAYNALELTAARKVAKAQAKKADRNGAPTGAIEGKSLGTSPNGIAVTWAVFLAHRKYVAADCCLRQWKGRVVSKSGGKLRDKCRVSERASESAGAPCTRSHTALSEKQAAFDEAVVACGLARDKGWTPTEAELGRMRAKGTKTPGKK